MTLDSRRFSLAVVVVLAIAAGTVAAQRSSSPIPSRPPTPTQAPDWVARSNEHTRVVLEAQARLAPEGAAQVGVSGVDEQIRISAPGIPADPRQVTRMQQELQRRLNAEQDPLVRQDLEILIQAAGSSCARLDIGERLLLPYINAPAAIFNSLRACSTIRFPSSGGAPRSPGSASTPARSRVQALHRARAGTGARAAPAQGTARTVSEQVERDLGNVSFFASGLDELFKKYDLAEAAPCSRRSGPSSRPMKGGARGAAAAHPDRLQAAARALCQQPRAVRRRHPAGGAGDHGAQGLRGDSGGDAEDRRGDRTGTGEPEGRLPRR